MQASLSWLRTLCPFEEEADAVARALTDRGLTVDSVNPSGDDVALEIDVPANRPDCLGHRGLARELGAAFGVPLVAPALAPKPAGNGNDQKLERLIRVEIDDPALCSRYTASLVRGVQVGPSPEWVIRRLEICGLRSINNVVDASNLVLLELGNPIHFFDLEKIRGGLIRVRLAEAAESLRTLDEVERKLEPETLVIADGERAVALAGVMGGADSEIGETTSNVLVEAAWFAPASIRRTARRLGLQSDASHRFERGVDPNALLTAQNLAQGYLVSLAGGSASDARLDVHPAPYEPRKRILELGQIRRLLGYQPSRDQVVEALDSLELAPKLETEESVAVQVPSWRVDLEREADLVEEVARHIGYDRIPLPPDRAAPQTDHRSAELLEERARDSLAHAGFREAFGYAMIGKGADEPFLLESARPSLELSHPLAESLSVLRRSMLPGLLSFTDLNLRRGVREVRLFEVGRVFLPGSPGEFPDESSRTGIAWCGTAASGHWADKSRNADFFDLAGLIEHLIRSLSPDTVPQAESVQIEGFHPGRVAAWKSAEGKTLAWGGQLHPSRQDKDDPPILLAEIDLDPMVAREPVRARYRALPRLTPVTRDLALVMPADARFAEVLELMSSVESPVPAIFRGIDRYEGPPLPAGQSSLTVRVTLSPDERTLTEEEIESYRLALIETLQTHGGLEIR